MSNFFTEIERCLRFGVAFDLLWDLEGLKLSGYREVVRIREDGKVEINESGKKGLHEGGRVPFRPPGKPPQLTIELSNDEGRTPLEITAAATIAQGSAAVYYTLGANAQGVYENAMVLWELLGPEAEDYRFLNREGLKPRVCEDGSVSTVAVDFRIEQPGNYRLRAATVDLAGRTGVVWKSITVKD